MSQQQNEKFSPKNEMSVIINSQVKISGASRQKSTAAFSSTPEEDWDYITYCG